MNGNIRGGNNQLLLRDILIQSRSIFAIVVKRLQASYTNLKVQDIGIDVDLHWSETVLPSNGLIAK